MALFNKFGSAWREKAFYTDPDEKLHVADAAHSLPSGDPNPVWESPADINDQADFLYDADAVVGDFVSDASGMVLDTTPWTHDEGGDFGSEPNDLAAINANAQTAGRDFGASRADNFAVPPFQDSSTRYVSPRFEGLDGTPVAPVALVRGLNSDPANNPEGFRRGWVEQTFTERRMYDPERTHDRRLLTPNTAYAETNQAAIPGTSGSPYDTLARAIKNVNQRPMIRREPPAMSQSIETDGSEEPEYQYDSQPSDWVAG